MFGIRLKNYRLRDGLMKFLQKHGIETRTFFCSLSSQPFLKKIKNYSKHKCPISELMWKDGLYLPSGNNLKQSEILYISKIIKLFFKK